MHAILYPDGERGCANRERNGRSLFGMNPGECCYAAMLLTCEVSGGEGGIVGNVSRERNGRSPSRSNSDECRYAAVLLTCKVSGGEGGIVGDVSRERNGRSPSRSNSGECRYAAVLLTRAGFPPEADELTRAAGSHPALRMERPHSITLPASTTGAARLVRIQVNVDTRQCCLLVK